MGNRRKRAKKCSCDRLNPSCLPCRQCIRAEKRQRKAKEKQKKNKKVMTETASSSTSSEKPIYAVLGTTFVSVLTSEAEEMFAKIRIWLDSGSLTDFLILVPLWASSRHARRHIARILAEKDASWASDYLVYQWPHESVESFVLRATNAYDCTHFFDVDREVLCSLAKSPYHLQRVNQYQVGQPDAWLKIEGWLAKSCPHYVPVIEKAQEAGVIISIK